MVTALLIGGFAAVYLGANGLTYGGQNRDSFAQICAESHRDPLVQGIAVVVVGLVVAANVYL